MRRTVGADETRRKSSPDGVAPGVLLSTLPVLSAWLTIKEGASLITGCFASSGE